MYLKYILQLHSIKYLKEPTLKLTLSFQNTYASKTLAHDPARSVLENSYLNDIYPDDVQEFLVSEK